MNNKWKIKWYVLLILTLALFGRILCSFLPKIPEAHFTIKSPVRQAHAETPVIPTSTPQTPPSEAGKRKRAIVKITEQNVMGIIDRLILCESRGERIEKPNWDVVGYAHGQLQYHKGTWEAFSKESGIVGDPMNRADAIKMTRWALLNGKAYHWTCSKIIGIL